MQNIYSWRRFLQKNATPATLFPIQSNPPVDLSYFQNRQYTVNQLSSQR
jgi:hypothetical protein